MCLIVIPPFVFHQAWENNSKGGKEEERHICTREMKEEGNDGRGVEAGYGVGGGEAARGLWAGLASQALIERG